MTAGLRSGSRWYLRVALAVVLLVDLVILTVMLATDAPGPRTLADAPGILIALGGRPFPVAILALLGGAAIVRFATGPGRVLAALGALAMIGILCEARAALHGGPERFLFAGGTVLVGWIAGIAFVRAAHGDRESEERGAEIGAIAALASIYVNAAMQKLGSSGIGWADGDDLRMLLLTQRPFSGAGSSPLAALALGSRGGALAMAAFVEIAQLAAIVYPFDARARAIVGSMLLAFHAGVRLLTPISFPQSMMLLLVFSYPWGRLLERRGIAAPDPSEVPTLARSPRRGAAAIAGGAALLAVVSFVPPVRLLVVSLSHAAERPIHEDTVAPPSSFDAAAAAPLGIHGLGELLGPCQVTELTAPAAGESRVELSCEDGGELAIEIAPTGTRPFQPPRTVRGYDIFYENPGEHPATPATFQAVLEAITARLAANVP